MATPENSPQVIGLATEPLPSPQSHPEESYDYDVIIVGAGIVGATLAAALQKTTLSVALVEARPVEAQLRDGRAYHVSMLSGRILQGLGLWETIVPKLATFRQIHLSDNLVDHDSARVVRFNPTDLGTDAVGYVATHGVLVKTLYDELHQSDRVTWYCPATVTQVDYQPEGALVHLNHQGTVTQRRCKVVVAADGSKSPIRQGAGIRTRGWQYWQSCITCKVKPEKPQPEIAYERFQPSGPFAILPLPDNTCQIVWTAPHAEARAYAALDDEAFLQELTKRYGNQMGRLALASDRYVFSVQLMQSDCYVSPRLALVGDAAHSCHPVGGQGLNMGIRDAAALADVLSAAHQKGQDIGDLAVLRQYASWRQGENLTILGFTDLLDRVFSTTWWPIVGLRRLGLYLLQTLQPLKSFALRLMTGLVGRLPSLAR